MVIVQNNVEAQDLEAHIVRKIIGLGKTVDVG